MEPQSVTPARRSPLLFEEDYINPISGQHQRGKQADRPPSHNQYVAIVICRHYAPLSLEISVRKLRYHRLRVAAELSVVSLTSPSEPVKMHRPAEWRSTCESGFPMNAGFTFNLVNRLSYGNA